MNPGQRNDEDRPGLLPRIAHAVRNIFPHNINQNRTLEQQHQPSLEDVEMMNSSQTLAPPLAAPVSDIPPALEDIIDTSNEHFVPPSFQNPDEDSDESMPSLQSVSNSSDDEDMSDASDEASEDEIVPMLVPRTSRRRSRGQEDNDEDRDRRNPAERTGNDHRTRARSPLSNESHTTPPVPQQPTPSTQSPTPPQVPPAAHAPNPPRMPFRFFDILRHPPHTNSANARSNNNNNDSSNNNDDAAPLPTGNNSQGREGRDQPRNFIGGIAISIPGPDGRLITAPLPLPEGGNPLQFILTSLFGPGLPDAGPGVGAPAPNQPADGQTPPPFADILARFTEFMTASINESQREDPDRAKRLVAGLEAVPTGLVRRLERVGDVGGGSDNGTGGDSVCAICWDTLLGGDVDAWKKTEENNEDTPQVNPAAIPLPESRSSTPSLASESSLTPPPMSIVSMPCAHVFHASCLLPWFTRPNQTTCPTCRFNIDPDGLTRSPPRPPQEQGRSQGLGANPTNEANRNDGNAAANAMPPLPHFLNPLRGQDAETGDNDQDHDHDHHHVEDIDVFLDLAVDVGFDDFSDEEGMPTLNPINPGRPNEPHPPSETDEFEDMPGLEPVYRAPTGQASSSRSNSTASTNLPGLEPVRPTPHVQANASSSSPVSSQPSSTGTRNITIPPVPPASSSQQPAPAPPPVFFGPPRPSPANAPPHPNNPTNGENIHRSRFGLDIIFATDSQGITRSIATGFTNDQEQDREELADEWIEDQVWVIEGPPEGDPVDEDANGAREGGGGPGIGIFGTFGIPFFPGINDPDRPNPGSRPTPPAAGAPTTGNGDPTTFLNGTPPAGNGAPTNNQTDGRPPEIAELLRSILLRQNRGGNQPAGAAPGGVGPGRVGLGPRFRPRAPPDERGNFVFFGPDAGAQRDPPNPNATPMPAAGPAPASSNAQPSPPSDNNNADPRRINLPPLFSLGQGNEATDNANPNQRPRDRHALPALLNLFSGLPIFTRPAAGETEQPPRPRNAPFTFGAPRMRRSAPREPKEWTIPPPPGLTLRQRVERAEREAGLRCDDVSCGVGPFDDEPEVNEHVDTVRIHVRGGASEAGGEPKYLCAHKFHPSCLVSAERVAWSAKNEDEEKEVGNKEWIDVDCPVCRHAGSISKEVWQEGVRASEI